jgi:GNAT superfamily N-acetyltransferase
VAITIRRLEQGDIVDQFDCGEEALNSYLKKHAWNNQDKSFLGVTYVAIEEAAPGVVLGYFTLANSSIKRDQLPKKHVRGLPPYDVPLMLLARLAVHRGVARKGIGAQLVKEAFRITLAVAEQSGCRCLITEAYTDRIDWYAKFGFIALEGGASTHTQKMFLDVRTLRDAARVPRTAIR